MSLLVKTAQKIDSVLSAGGETAIFGKPRKINTKKIAGAIFVVGALIGGGREMLNSESSSPGEVAGESIEGGLYVFGKALGVTQDIGSAVVGFSADRLDSWGLEEIPNFFVDARDTMKDAGDTVNDGVQSIGD